MTLFPRLFFFINSAALFARSALGALALLFVFCAPGHAATYVSAPTTFTWIDPAAHTTAVWSNPTQGTSGVCDVTGDDSVTVLLNIGFTFQYGAIGYTQLRIMTNGRLGFNNPYCNAGTQVVGPPRTYTLPYPDANLVNTMKIYGADMDLTPAGSGGGPGATTCPAATCNVKYATLGTAPNRQFVVTWTAVPDWGDTGSFFNLQIILNENGTFVYQFGASNNPDTGQADIGWELTTADFALITYTNIGALANTAIRFSRPVASFTMAAPASASTCSSATITLTAKDAGGATLAGYIGTANLTSSSNKGTWALSSGSGTFTPGAANSGAASYTFAPSDNGVATFTFSDQRAENITLSAVDSVIGTAAGTSGTIQYRDNALVLTSNDALGQEVAAGRPHTLQVAFWKKDIVTGNCSVATTYTGAKNLDMWYVASASQPAGALAPKVSTSSTCAAKVAIPNAMPASLPASNNITLTFTNGVAPVYLCTSDVGQYALGARDDTRLFDTVADVSSVSSNFTARPFGLSIRSIASGATPNPGGTATAGSKFITAETTFGLTVAGVLWTAAQDVDNNGVPDAGSNLSANALTPAFAAATTLSASSWTPALGAGGALGGATSILSGSYSSGSASVANLTWNNSGSVRISATAANYLASGFTVPASPSVDIGRFFPTNYVVTAASSANACAGGGFTYMDQPALSLAFTLTARGSAGGALSHHSAALGYGFLPTVTLAAVDNLDGVDRAARLSYTAPTWAAGAWALSTSTATFARSAAPDGQFDSLQLGVWVNDPDAADLSVKDMSRSVAGACAGAGCTTKSIGSTLRLRHGRLWMGSSFSYALGGLPLSMPVQAQYWTRSAGGASLGWSLNALDSCTSIPAASISRGNYTGITSAVGAAFSLANGAGTLKVTPSPAGTAGKADIAINLALTAGALNACPAPALPAATAANLPWLRSNFCSPSYNQDPSGRATFGPAKGGSDALIFQRELY